VLSSPFRRFGDRPPPGVAVVYATDDGEVTYLGDRPLSYGERFHSRYRRRYEVDVRDHRRTVELRSTPLPSRGDRHFFVATVDAAFRVHDPAEVVRRSVRDALPVVYGFLADKLKMITRNFEIDSPAEAEEAIRQAFVGPVALPEGITIFEVSARLRPDDLASEYLRARLDAARALQSNAHESAALEELADERRLFAQNAERAAVAERPMTAADMALLHLIRHPEDAEKVTKMLLEHERASLQAKDMRDQRTSDFVNFMMAAGLVQPPDFQPFSWRPATNASTGSASSSLPQTESRDEEAVPAPHSDTTGGFDLERSRANQEAAAPHNLDAAEVIYMYLDTDDADVARRVFTDFDSLARAVGYSDAIDEEVRRGSFWRKAKTFIVRSVTSDEVALRLAKVERAVELAQLDNRQAEVDGKEAEAVAQLLESLADIPQACMRVGSLLIVKFQDPSGPVVLARTLTQPEIRALNRFPEIQARPRDVMKSLDTAVATDLETASVEHASDPTSR
jgi:hypothetical protein